VLNNRYSYVAHNIKWKLVIVVTIHSVVLKNTNLQNIL
jgi:hypothetical protein